MTERISSNLFRGDSERNPMEREVSPEHLAEVFGAKKFSNHLRRSWEIVMKTDHESGFAVGQDVKTGEWKWGRVVGAGEDVAREIGMDPISEHWSAINNLEEKSLKINSREHLMPIIELHTHPDGSFMPSEADLSGLVNTRDLIGDEAKINAYPISCIAANRFGSGGAIVDVLLLQEKPSPKPHAAELGSMEYGRLKGVIADAGKGDDHSAIVAECNRSSILVAAMLEFQCDTQGKKVRITPAFTQEELVETLRPFARTFHSLPEGWDDDRFDYFFDEGDDL